MMHYVPKQLIQSTQSAQVQGAANRALINNLRGDGLEAIAQRHQLHAIDPDHWYPQQQVLDYFKDLVSNIDNVTERLVAAGMALLQQAIMPPNIDNINDALQLFGQVYLLNHKDLHPQDKFTIHTLGANHLIVVDSTQYPDELHYGYIWAWVRKYKPMGNSFIVRIIPNPYLSTNPGTAFEIKWSQTQRELLKM